MTPLADRRAHDEGAARLVARWFHGHPGNLEGYTVETGPDGPYVRATLMLPLTGEEYDAWKAAAGL